MCPAPGLGGLNGALDSPDLFSMKSLILLSGGVDSAACAAFYSRLGHSVRGLFVDYGQPVRSVERESAAKVAAHYSIPLQSVVCQGPEANFSGEISGRNAFLITTAMVFNPKWTGIIALGIHAGTEYYDCGHTFVEDISRVVEGYSDGRVALGVPFLNWTKKMIWDFCLANHVPVEITWSCEVGPKTPCGKCLSCRELEAIYARQTDLPPFSVPIIMRVLGLFLAFVLLRGATRREP